MFGFEIMTEHGVRVLYTSNFVTGDRCQTMEQAVQAFEQSVVHLKLNREKCDVKFVEVSDQPVVKDEDVVINRHGSKAERALLILKENQHLSRKEIIKMYVDILGMSEAGSATYYYNAKKQLG